MPVVLVMQKQLAEHETAITADVSLRHAHVGGQHLLALLHMSVFLSLSHTHSHTLSFVDAASIFLTLCLFPRLQVGRLIVGQNGLFSTPAVSALIRRQKARGALPTHRSYARTPLDTTAYPDVKLTHF